MQRQGAGARPNEFDLARREREAAFPEWVPTYRGSGTKRPASGNGSGR